MNIALAIMHLYPDAKPLVDFTVIKDEKGQKIVEWNLDAPQPTEQELETAWDEYQANPPQEEPSELDMLGQRIVDLEIRLMLGGM